MVSSVGIDENAVGLNIWQTGQKRKRRKKDRADDPSDIEGWKGPWARFKDEKTNEELAASGEIRAEMDEILEKRRAKKALRRANRDEEEVSHHFSVVVSSIEFAPQTACEIAVQDQFQSSTPRRRS